MTVVNLPGHKPVQEVLDEVQELHRVKNIGVIMVQGLYDDGTSFSLTSSITIQQKCFIKSQLDAEITDFFFSEEQ